MNVVWLALAFVFVACSIAGILAGRNKGAGITFFFVFFFSFLALSAFALFQVSSWAAFVLAVPILLFAVILIGGRPKEKGETEETKAGDAKK
ncbi:MAG TPA: hypothetical protein DCG87_06250 [Synergistaceae bacterium]|jgi:hypothetical protein|nr:hypothetical protein [Synergistaceae bacterium]